MDDSMIERGLIFYIGCALIPTPPSPCPDFGLQLLFVLGIGLIAPKFLITPINVFVIYLGRFCKWFFGRIPGIRIIVIWVDISLKKFKKALKKKRKVNNKIINFFYKIILKEDIFQRIVFGYFVSIIVGSILMIIAIL